MSNFSNNAPNQDGLRDAFEGIRAENENGDELFFDPATGELRTARGADDPDRVPATQMAREGFFLRESEGLMGRLPPSSEVDIGTPSPAEREGLVVDSETGQLQATGGADATDDRVPATRMVREGFF